MVGWAVGLVVGSVTVGAKGVWSEVAGPVCIGVAAARAARAGGGASLAGDGELDGDALLDDEFGRVTVDRGWLLRPVGGQ
eukprot:2064655-Prymnesium_polylepis.1